MSQDIRSLELLLPFDALCPVILKAMPGEATRKSDPWNFQDFEERRKNGLKQVVKVPIVEDIAKMEAELKKREARTEPNLENSTDANSTTTTTGVGASRTGAVVAVRRASVDGGSTTATAEAPFGAPGSVRFEVLVEIVRGICGGSLKKI